MKRARHAMLAGALLAAALALSACGGGSSGGDGGSVATTSPPATSNPPPTQPPVASDPFDTFMAYLSDLVNRVLDTSEPAEVAQYDPAPSSETREPIALP